MRSRAEAAAASLGDVLGDETGEMSAIAVDRGAASGSGSGSGSAPAATGESTSIAVGSGVAFFAVDVLADRRARWDEPFDAVDSFADSFADDSGCDSGCGPAPFAARIRRDSLVVVAFTGVAAAFTGVLDFATDLNAVPGVSPAVAYSALSSSVAPSSTDGGSVGKGVPPARLAAPMADLPVAGVFATRLEDPGIAPLWERGVSTRVAEVAPGVRAALAADLTADGGFSLACSAVTSAAACFAAALVCALSRSATGVLRPAVCALSNQASGCTSAASPTSKS